MFVTNIESLLPGQFGTQLWNLSLDRHVKSSWCVLDREAVVSASDLFFRFLFDFNQNRAEVQGQMA